MKITLMSAIRNITSNIGRCPYCMKMSFNLALAATLVAGATTLLTSSTTKIGFAWIIAFGFTVIYASHLIAYSIRSTFVAIHSKESSWVDQPNFSRRSAFGTFAKTLGVVTVATAVPICSVFAQSDDPCQTCVDRCYKTEQFCVARCNNGPVQQGADCIGNCQINRAECTSNCC